MNKKKEIQEMEVTTLEYVTAPIIGVGEIPEGDINNLIPETIKPIGEKKDETVSAQTETVLIYCGPTNNHITRYTSYKNGYPVHLKEHIEKFQVLKSLFVEPNNFAEFDRKVDQAGTVEHIWFEKAKEYFNKAVK